MSVFFLFSSFFFLSFHLLHIEPLCVFWEIKILIDWLIKNKISVHLIFDFFIMAFWALERLKCVTPCMLWRLAFGIYSNSEYLSPAMIRSKNGVISSWIQNVKISLPPGVLLALQKVFWNPFYAGFSLLLIHWLKSGEKEDLSFHESNSIDSQPSENALNHRKTRQWTKHYLRWPSEV